MKMHEQDRHGYKALTAVALETKYKSRKTQYCERCTKLQTDEWNSIIM